MQWPPEHLRPVFHTIATHKALYQGPESPDLTRGAGWEPRSRRGGVVGAVSRILWGDARPIERPPRHHVPLPADLATLSADLLFSESPRILPPDEVSDEIKTRIDEVVNTADNHSKFLQGAEIASALGGVFFRVVWDEDTAPYPMLDVVYPDQAVPVWQWGRLKQVTFWSVLEVDSGRVWRHLETHKPGRIEHELYVGDKDSLGLAHPLSDHEDTAWLEPLVDGEAGFETGSDQLTATYITNAMPSRQFGDNPELSPYGRSDYEGVEQLFLDLDDAYTSWMRDIRLAKSRLFVDDTALIDKGPGKGSTFDDDHEVYTPLRGYGSMAEGRKMIEAQQFAIRNEEHKQTIQHILYAILRATGYSPSTIGENEQSNRITAKEVRSRETASRRTWTKKQRYWEAGLKPLIETMLEVDAFIFGSVLTERVNLEFKISNSLEGDIVDLADTIQKLDVADAISLDQKLRMMYPNWSRQQLNEEAEKIRGQGFEVPEWKV